MRWQFPENQAPESFPALAREFLLHAQVEYSFSRESVEKYGECLKQIWFAIGGMPVCKFSQADLLSLRFRAKRSRRRASAARFRSRPRTTMRPTRNSATGRIIRAATSCPRILNRSTRSSLARPSFALAASAVAIRRSSVTKFRKCSTGIELSTNWAENSMRPIGIGRKNWLHLGSKEAGPKIAAIFSIVESCRKLNVPIRQYLADVLPGLADRSIQSLAELTPVAYAAKLAK